MSAARPAFVGGRGGGWGGAGLLGSRLPRRCGCLSRWRVPGVGEPRAADACRGEDIAPPRRMDGCRGRDRSVSCPASWGGLAPTRSAHHPRSRWGPGPAPRALRPARTTARGALLLHCLRVRKAERTRTRPGTLPCVCLSVRPSPTSDLRGLPTIAHRREGKRRHANLQVTPRGTPLSLTPSSAGPPIPDKSIGHRITPRGLWWPLRGACPPCGRRRGPRVR